MAQSTLREVRRPKGSARRALTAASQSVTDPGKLPKATNGALGVGTANWQAEAWRLYRVVGELHFFVGWKAGSCSRCRLIASEIDPETGFPTGSLSDTAEAKRVAEYVRAIADGPLGQADMIRRLVRHIALPGESWLAVLSRGRTYVDGTPRFEWFVLGNKEWRKKTGNVIELSLPDGTKHDVVRGVDSFVRIWEPDAEDASKPDSSVRSALEPLLEIERTGKKIKNAAKSRLVGNGVLFLPAEMSLPSPHSPTAEGQPVVPGAPPPVMAVTGVNATETLGELLYQQGVAAVEDEDSQAAFLPLLATVPGDKLDKIQHVKFGNEVTDDEVKIRVDAVTRLAMSLDVSPERLLGFGKSNHWSAWQIGDDDVQLHISPVMSLICQAIYREILRPLLEREGIDADKYVLWFDASGLTADPDITDEAQRAKEAGAFRNEAYLRAMGLPEDGGYDLTTREGIEEFAREAVTANPELISNPVFQMLLSSGGDLDGIEWPAAPALEPAAGDDNADEDPDTEGSEPDTEDEQDAIAASVGRSHSAAEFILAERLLVTRAKELAGKRRVRTNEERGRLSRYPAHEWHRYLPPLAAGEINKYTAGWDNGLNEVAARCGLDGDTTNSLRAAVLRSLTKELTSQVIDGEVMV